MFLAELSESDQRHYLELAYLMINADGIIAEEEKKTFALYKAEIPGLMEIPEYKTDDIDAPLSAFSKSDKTTRRKVYFELVSLAFTDMEYADEEKEMMDKVAQSFGLSENERREMDCIAEDLMKCFNRLGGIINGA